MSVPETRVPTAERQPSTTVTQVRVAVATARDARSDNEDAVGVAGWVLYGDGINTLEFVLPTATDDEGPVAVAVARGIEDAPDGQRAARIAAERLSRLAPNAPTVHERLVAAFRDANAAIVRESFGPPPGMGCAAASVVVRPDGSILVASVGDVRVFRVVDGCAQQITRDGRTGARDPSVRRCLGGGNRVAVEPHLYEVSVLPGDRFVLRSDRPRHDGSDAAAIQHTASRGTGRAAKDLVRAALEMAPDDDVTVAVLDLVGIRPEPVRRNAIGAEPTARIPPTRNAGSRVQSRNGWRRLLGA